MAIELGNENRKETGMNAPLMENGSNVINDIEFIDED